MSGEERQDGATPGAGRVPPPALGARGSSYPSDYVSDLTTLEEPPANEAIFDEGATQYEHPRSGRTGDKAHRSRAGRRRLLIAVVVAVIVAVVVGFTLLRSKGPTLAPRSVGPTAQLLSLASRSALPPLSGPAVGGGRVRWSALRGHVLVVNFWASWCGPCNAEQPLLNSASRALAGHGVRFVGVDIEDQQVAAQAFRSSHGVTYPSLFDPADAYTMRLRGQGPTYPPFTLVVNRRGMIAGRVLGSLQAGGGSAELVRLVHLVEAGR